MYNELYMKETSSLENNDDLDRKKVNNFAAQILQQLFWVCYSELPSVQ